MAVVGEAIVDIKAATGNLSSEISTALRSVKDAVINVKANIDNSAIKDVQSQIARASGAVINTDLDVNKADLDATISQIAGVDGEVIGATVDIVDGELQSVITQIAGVDGEVLDVVVNAEDGDLQSLISQIASVDGEIIDLKVNVDDSGLSELDATAANTSAGLAGAAASGGLLSKVLSPTGLGLAGVAAGVGSIVSQTAQLDKGLREVASLQVDNFGLEEAEQTMRDFAAATGESIQETDALYNALSAGVEGEDALGFLIDSTKLASAGVAELTPTVSVLTSALNAYGDEAGSTADISNALFATVQGGVTTIPELASSLGDITTDAAAAGVSFNELVAAVSTSTGVTQNTSKSVTGLRQVIIELNKDTSIAGKAFQEISGKTFKEFTDESGTLQDALNLINTEAENSGKSLGVFFGSAEAAGVAGQLVGENADKFAASIENVNSTVEEGNAVQNAYEINQESFSKQLEILKNRFEEVGTAIGAKVLPLLTSLTATISSSVEPAVNALSDAFNFVKDLVTQANELGILEPLLIGIGAAILTLLVPAFIAWAVSAGAAAVATLAAAAPFIAVGAAIALLVGGLIYAYQNFETFRNIVDTVKNVIVLVVTEVFKLQSAIAEFLIPVVISVIGWIASFVGKLFSIQLAFVKVIASVGSFVAGFVGAIAGLVARVVGFFVGLQTTIISTVVGWIASVIGAVVGFVGNIISRVAGLASSVGSKFRELAGSALSAVSGMASNILGRIGSFVGSMLSSIGSLASSVVSKFREMGIRAGTAVVTAVGAIPGKLLGLASRFAGAARQLAQKIIDAIKSRLSSFNPLSGIDIPFFAQGGIVDRATLGVIGEAGREVVVPLTKPNRALQLARESGLEELILNASSGGGDGTAQVVTTTDNSQVINNINVTTREGQDPGLIGASLLDSLSLLNRSIGA